MGILLLMVVQTAFGQDCSTCGCQVTQTIPAKTPCLGPYKINTGDGKGSGFNASQYESWAYWDVNAANYNNSTLCLPFRFLKPKNYNQTNPKLYPLIVMLNGAGECGLDNARVLYNGGLEHLNAVNNGKYDGFVAFPQSPYGNWASNNPEDTIWDAAHLESDQLDRMFAMVDSLVLRFKIDPDRIVVHGLSAGGTGTLAAIYHRPDLFAAALPMSATTSTSPWDANVAYPNPPWYDQEVTDKVRRNMGFVSPIPIWWFQGGVDVNPSPNITTPSVQFLRDSGAISTSITKYTIYPTTGHFTWPLAYAETDFFPYIQRQNKRNIYLEGPNPICCDQSTQLGFSPGFYNYQWFKDGVALPTKNSNKLINITQGGVYYVQYTRRGSAVVYQSLPVTIVNNGGVNSHPVVNLTSPATNLTQAIPASFVLSATAIDADGSILKVEFYQGTKLLRSMTTSPYTYTWSNVAVGTYALTAKAYDNFGVSTVSPVVNVAVTSTNTLPTVGMTSPANNTSFSSPASITLQTNAADVDGIITKVEFYNGVTLLGSASSSPFQYTWSGVGVGTYAITAKAYDNSGGITTSDAITLNVALPVNQAPVINITSPLNNSTYLGGSYVSFSADATDADGYILGVDFYVDGALISSDAYPPYSADIWNISDGAHLLTAVATDNSTSTTSVSVNLTAGQPANQNPTVSLTTPLPTTTFTEPASIDLVAVAADADGTIVKVDFYNGPTFLGSTSSTPYSFTWTGVLAGTYSITAQATDNAGGITTSAAVTVNVLPSINQVPSVAITSPLDHTDYAGSLYLPFNVDASDDGYVAMVDFYLDGALIATDAYPPYSTDIYGFSVGTHVLTAVATDNGNATSSASVTITVGLIANQAPTVSLASPINNATFNAPATVTLGATASDVDGSIAQVDFYNGTTLLGSDLIPPFQVSWSGVPVGTYSLTAVATDNLGTATTSGTVTMSVVVPANVFPTVNLASPVNNSTYTAPASLTLGAAASDMDGNVSKVDFYNGATLLGSDVTTPYQFFWTGVPAGTYVLTAVATDNLGASTTSGTVTITVTVPVNVLPTVSLASPVNNSTYTAPATVTLGAAASDADGTISKVDFYNGATLLGTDATSPYQFTWSSVAVGTYTLTAKATDNLGAVTTSSIVSITVTAANTPPTVSLTSPANNAAFTAAASVAISATAADANGTVSKVDFYNGATLLGTDATSPYQYTWSGVAAGTYTLTAKATDNLGAVTTSSIVTITVSSFQDMYGPACATINQSVTYTLDASHRANSTTYGWWYTGSSTSITPVSGQLYSAVLLTGPNFAAGQVCVGINYSVSPWYISYCKSISKCTSGREEEAPVEQFVLVANNGINGDFLLTSSRDISSMTVISVSGTVVYTMKDIPAHRPFEFGSTIPVGLHIIQIHYTDGGIDVKKIQKAQ